MLILMIFVPRNSIPMSFILDIIYLLKLINSQDVESKTNFYWIRTLLKFCHASRFLDIKMGKWCVESNVACLHDSYYPPKNTKWNEEKDKWYWYMFGSVYCTFHFISCHTPCYPIFIKSQMKNMIVWKYY